MIISVNTFYGSHALLHCNNKSFWQKKTKQFHFIQIMHQSPTNNRNEPGFNVMQPLTPHQAYFRSLLHWVDCAESVRQYPWQHRPYGAKQQMVLTEFHYPSSCWSSKLVEKYWNTSLDVVRGMLLEKWSILLFRPWTIGWRWALIIFGTMFLLLPSWFAQYFQLQRFIDSNQDLAAVLSLKNIQISLLVTEH